MEENYCFIECEIISLAVRFQPDSYIINCLHVCFSSLTATCFDFYFSHKPHSTWVWVENSGSNSGKSIKYILCIPLMVLSYAVIRSRKQWKENHSVGDIRVKFNAILPFEKEGGNEMIFKAKKMSNAKKYPLLLNISHNIMSFSRKRD